MASETPQLGGRPVMQNPASLGPAAPQGAVEAINPVALGAYGPSGVKPVTSSVVEPLPVEQNSSSDVSVRCTGRVNACQHSNRYHLPQAVGEVVGPGTGASVSNSVSALFRPWN